MDVLLPFLNLQHMLKITNCIPDEIRDQRLKLNLDLKLIDNFLYLLSVANEVFCKYGQVIEFFEEMRSSRSLTKRHLKGTFFALNSQLEYLLSIDHVDKAEMFLNDLQLIEYLTDKIDVNKYLEGNYSDLEKHSFQDVMKREYDNTYASKYDAVYPSQSNDVEEIIRAIEAIKIIDLESYKEINALVSNIFLIGSNNIHAGSSFKTFGTILLRELKENQNWTTYYEHIIHEAAHLHLYSVWANNSIIENDNQELYSSPVRKEGRPLSGIYHAMFVLARIIRSTHLFKNNKNYEAYHNDFTAEYNNESGISIEEKFYDTCNTLEKHAKLSDVGQAIFLSCKDTVSNCI